MFGHVETSDRVLNANLGPPSWLDWIFLLSTLANVLQEPTNLYYLPASPTIGFPSQDPSPSGRDNNHQSSGATPDLAPSNTYTFLDGSVLPLSGDVNPQVGLLRTIQLQI
jgi:hypothetical protein